MTADHCKAIVPGFDELAEPQRAMERHNSDVYRGADGAATLQRHST